MGNSHMKDKSYASEKVVEGLKNKVRVLQGEMNEIMLMRENESQVYERETMVFAMKEDEWRKERRKLKGEIKGLRKKLNYIEERFENEMMVFDKNGNEFELLGISYLLENMMEEQSQREEAAEKWKQLYFAVKIELDELIHRTHQGDTMYIKAKENYMSLEKLKKQLKAKDETIEVLQAQVVSLEEQDSKREREVDILRQSLRIMSHQKNPTKIAKRNSKNLN